jgi:hypothetical protein
MEDRLHPNAIREDDEENEEEGATELLQVDESKEPNVLKALALEKEKKYVEAFQLWDKLARDGLSYAQYMMGYRFVKTRLPWAEQCGLP